jgi:8-oxo-dGTP pyrophosphatase MutT (NUDIX family)
MKKAAVIAIHHPDLPDLILHGRRKDSGKWSLPGGKVESDESDKKAALRELMEETGITSYEAKKWGSRVFETPKGKVEVTLFICKCPKDLVLKAKDDPDHEFNNFKFLNPMMYDGLHIPLTRNILVEYLSDK